MNPLRWPHWAKVTMNSNKHVNETLRGEYRESHPHDELAFELGITFKDNLGFVPMWIEFKIPGVETNHLNTNPRWDLWSNLIKLSAPAHRWFHAHLNEGRILCLLAKAEKSKRLGDSRDFNLDELAICRPNLAGWVESVELEAFVEPYRNRLLELIAAKAKEIA